MTQEPTPDSGLGEVKLSCRNVWKIYGTDPAGFFPGGRGAVDDVEGGVKVVLGDLADPIDDRDHAALRVVAVGL